MMPTFTKLITLMIFSIGLSSPFIWAQKKDHLSMILTFKKDSTVQVNAKYQTILKEKVDSIYFLLNPSYELDTIASKGLKSYKIIQKAGVPLPFWNLKYNDLINVNEPLIVEFKYKINLSQQNHMKSNWIELNADKLWFPNLNALNNEFTYDVSIIDLPKSYRLMTHTDAIVTKVGNHIYIKKETPWYEVLLLAGNNMKEWHYDENITLIGSETITDSTFHSLGSKVKKSIDLLNSTFSKSDPITSFKVVLRNTDRKELGFQFNRRNMIVTGTDFNDYGNLSHEIAHFWWSRANFINEPWMNESFANYSMYLVLKAFDIEDYKKILAENREIAKTAIPVIKANLFATDSYNSYYYKGTLHLLSLEEKIGTNIMYRLLSSCVEKNINTTAGFLMELERLTTKEQRAYFEALLAL